MSTLVTEEISLAALRKATKEFTPDSKPYTAQQVAEMVANEIGRDSYDYSTVLKWEAKGVANYRILTALSKVYRCPIAQIIQASVRS